MLVPANAQTLALVSVKDNSIAVLCAIRRENPSKVSAIAFSSIAFSSTLALEVVMSAARRKYVMTSAQLGAFSRCPAIYLRQSSSLHYFSSCIARLRARLISDARSEQLLKVERNTDSASIINLVSLGVNTVGVDHGRELRFQRGRCRSCGQRCCASARVRDTSQDERFGIRQDANSNS